MLTTSLALTLRLIAARNGLRMIVYVPGFVTRLVTGLASLLTFAFGFSRPVKRALSLPAWKTWTRTRYRPRVPRLSERILGGVARLGSGLTTGGGPPPPGPPPGGPTSG